ncbi:OsmC family protein [Bdellovibrio sp. NC01]|uniref:OsmC family protein n=1 Tax=Bdellovibrio sp. NC01 TaxID=2220073 RepID=UPI001157A450|nr:OsmC family protein [Bdellovibrio sp. NC01]QDK39744.1 OsmC family peroxiredoxin [Bdellovibrio sp. NC01]
MDTKVANGGDDRGASPKEVLLGAICACSGIDVASILKKMRVDLQSLEVNAESDTTQGYPSIFAKVMVDFKVTSPDAKPDQVIKSVDLSMTKYCGVSAMVNPTSPIYYRVFLNGAVIHEAKADFTESLKESEAGHGR